MMLDTASNISDRSVSVFTLLLCVIACAVYFHFFFNRAEVEIDLEVQQKTYFKLYWGSGDQQFSEKRRGSIRVIPGKNNYSFGLTDISKVDRIRLDPIQYPGKATLRSVIIRQPGFEDYSIDLNMVKPLNDISSFRTDDTGLHLVASNIDPYFLIIPEFRTYPVDWFNELFRYLLICLTIILVVKACKPLHYNYSYVPVMLSMVLVLVLTMAAVSKRNAHPDERVHLEATTYYQDHWLPPEIDDPAIEKTYSPYGISRLNNGEIYYLLAGKFSKIAVGFQIETLLSLRLFNVFLFSCILLYSIYSIHARLVALPFLISPQVWYIFSYCGSDAFGLFLCFLAGCQLVRPESYLNRILSPDNHRPLWYAIPLLSLLLAMLFLLKINYYPFIALSLFCVLWKVFVDQDKSQRRILLTRLFLVIVLAVIGAGLRMGADYYVNGTERQSKLLVMQEKLAHPWFKPSTELHKKHVTMFMKQRGTTLQALVQKHNWFGHSFVSGFGHYGYFTVAAPAQYYNLMKWAAGIFILFVFFTIFIRGTGETRLLAMVVLVLGFALIGASLHRSWTVDFQAQGRYLFPILPMIGVLLARSRNLFSTRLFTLQVCLLCALGLYSFIFIALVYIPRPF